MAVQFVYDTILAKKNGPDEDRTRYLFVANEALSQMSYRPKANK